MNHENTTPVSAWIDGACKGNPGPGGYGIVLKHAATGHVKHVAGGCQHSTNQRMELLAAITALRHLKTRCAITLYTDSHYLAQGWAAWLDGWIARGWKTAKGQAVKNADLWQQLVEAAQPHVLTLQWVTGQSGDPGHDAADRLAAQAAAYVAQQRQDSPARGWVRIVS